jgi:hypothetical protein
MVGLTRKQFVHDLYRDQLRRAAGARYVRSFEMRNERDVCDNFLSPPSGASCGHRLVFPYPGRAPSAQKFRSPC